MLDKYEVYRVLMDTKDLDLPKAQFNPDAQPILDARYLMKKEDGTLESNEDMLWRVACWVAKEDFTYDKDGVTFDNILATAKEFYNVMANGYFLPNSPTLRGAGRNASNLSGCFAIPVEDSRHSIFNALKVACDVMAFGGGTGFNFSKIRPHGDIVASTESKASGPISFMKIFDLAVGDVISQGGVRSGAMMGLLHYTHPDIMEFITCKRSGILTNFNISVGVDSKFFELAKQGLDYDLINPKDNSVWGQINAKDVLDAIIDNIWHNGDPGLLFMDRIEESNPTPKLGKLDHVNPCLTGNNWVTTSSGARRIYDIIHNPISMLKNGEFFPTTDEGFWESGIKECIRVTTKHGYIIEATTNHKVLSNNKMVELGSLSVGDDLDLSDNFNAQWDGEGTLDEGYLLGHLIGEGHFTENIPTWAVWSHDTGDIEVKVYLEGIIRQYPHRSDFAGFQKEFNGRQYIKIVELKKLTDNYNVVSINKQITDKMHNTSSDFQMGIIGGLFDTDGHIENNVVHGMSIRISSCNRDLLQNAQLMLSRLGIISKIYKRRDAHNKLMPDGHGGQKEYACQPEYQIVVSRNNILRFRDRIPIHNTSKRDKLNSAIAKLNKRGLYQEKFRSKIVSIENIGEQTVYDCTIPKAHSFDCNSFIVSNCGEISLLVGKEAGESCNLGSINLAKTLGDGGELLAETTRTAVHFLDNVIDANEYVHPEIESLTKGNRKIGLGVMGFADVLAYIEAPYGSPASMRYIDDVMQTIDCIATDASMRLAEKRGTFPNYAKSTWCDKMIPLRNASLTTIAPTGTLSTILGVNGGIEPFFAMSYKRGTLYVDGKPTEYIDVINSRLNDYLSDISGDIDNDLRPLVVGKASIQDIEEIPQDVKDIFKTAHDIDPITHLAVQDRFQMYIHNNISKTINAPHDATQEDIRQALMYAYENTCVRGITMYRDGCKEYQVLSTKETKQEKQDTSIKNIDFTSRPETLRGDTIKVNTPLGSLYVTINANDDGIQEVFLNIGRSGNDVKADAEALGRAVTFLFRTGISIDFIIDQFRHIGGSSVVGFGENRVASLPDGLALALEHYRDKQNPHEAKRIASDVSSGNYCPMCGQVLIRSEKCLKCVCGYSKC